MHQVWLSLCMAKTTFYCDDFRYWACRSGIWSGARAGQQLRVTSLADDYQIIDGAAQVRFDVTSNAEMLVSAYLFNRDGTAAGLSVKPLIIPAQAVLDVVAPKSGHYHLRVKAEPKQWCYSADFDLFLKDQAPTPGSGFCFPWRGERLRCGHHSVTA